MTDTMTGKPHLILAPDKRRLLGATDAAPLLGLGKWANQRDVYERVVNGTQKVETAAMRRGTKAEPEVRRRYAAETGCSCMVWPIRPVVLQHPGFEWARCSPDDIRTDDVLLEYKTASRWSKGWALGPPDDYVLQCQWGLWVTGLPEAHLYVAFGEEDSPGGQWLVTSTAAFEFQADAELHDVFARVGGEFWAQHILTQQPPAMEPLEKKGKSK